MFSEEIYNSLHNTNLKIEKDRNNNSTISTKGKPKIDKQTIKNESNDNVATTTAAVVVASAKEKKNVKISDTKSSIVSESCGTNTLKRKREAKSPVKCAADSQLEQQESSKKQQSSSSQTTTATILVSKTKTKSGLPLLLKK